MMGFEKMKCISKCIDEALGGTGGHGFDMDVGRVFMEE